MMLCGFPSSPAVAAGDAVAGRDKAKQCIVCHAINGESSRPDAPHLSGQVEMYLAEQLRAYRSGKRQSELMGIIAKPLSDQDIDDLAAWYASVKVTVEPIQ